MFLKLNVIILALLWTVNCYAQISTLPPAQPLTGDEQVPIDQSIGGVLQTVRTSASCISALSSSSSSGTPVTGSGVAGSIPAWVAPTVLGASSITDNGTSVTTTENLNVTQNLIGAITNIGSTILGATSGAASADLITSYVFCTAPGPASGCGGGDYDGVQGIGISNSGTTTAVVAGVAGYALANQPFTSVGPSSVALFGVGAVNVDGGSVWGLNTNVSDREYRVAQPSGTHNRRVTGAELDVSTSYLDTNVTALLIAGNSVVQPNNSTAISIVGQDFSSSTPGSIAKWNQALYTFDGTADLFAFIGSYCSSASHTQTCDSQGTQWVGYVSGTPGFGELEFGPGVGTNPCPSCNHATYQFQMNYGLNINTGGAVIRQTTDRVLEISGNLDLSSGTLIESRNDAGSAVEPLEVLAGTIFLNSNILQVNNGSGITTAFTGSCTGGSFHTINGIVVSCP